LFKFNTKDVDLTKRVCVKECPLFLDNSNSASNFKYKDPVNGDTNRQFVFDLTNNQNWRKSKEFLKSHVEKGNSVSDLT